MDTMKNGVQDRYGSFSTEQRAMSEAKKIMRNHTEKRGGKTLEEVAKHPHMD